MSRPGLKGALKRLDPFAATWRMPLLLWQTVFFVGPFLFMIAMSFFLVKNYRMTEAFEFVNWAKDAGPVDLLG